MQNEFDDHIKKQVDGFKLPPSPQVWNLVEAQLPEKKRRRFIFWWLPIGVLLIGFGIYELMGHHKNKNVIIERAIVQINDTIKIKPSNNLIVVEKINKNINKNESKIYQKNILQPVNNYTEKKVISKNEVENELKINKNENELNDKAVLKDGDKLIAKKTNKKDINKEQIKIDTIKNDIEKEKIANQNSEKLTDTSVDKIVQKEINAIEKDTSITKNKKGINKTNFKKIKWELIAEIGSSNTVGKAFGINDGSVYDVSNNLSASPGNGNTSTSTAPLAAPTASVSFALSLQRTKQITKHLSWFGSVGYKYLSNHQASGILVDSSATVGITNSFSSFDKADNVTNYYKFGNTINHNNYVHGLNVAFGLKYNINKVFSLNAGMELGYLLKTNWIQPDLNKSILYYSNKLTNKWNVGAKIGFDWQIANPFSIGVFYNYGFSKTSLAAAQQNLHWQAVGIKLSVELPFKK